jgi:hypothetical protein
MRARQSKKIIASLKVVNGKWSTRVGKRTLARAWHVFYVRMRRKKKRFAKYLHSVRKK